MSEPEQYISGLTKLPLTMCLNYVQYYKKYTTIQLSHNQIIKITVPNCKNTKLKTNYKRYVANFVANIHCRNQSAKLHK